MNVLYTTDRLDLRILHNTSDAPAILDFYERNREFLEPVEPARTTNFYTLEYQRNNMNWEYNAFVKSNYIRIWIFPKNACTPIGCISFSEFQKGVFRRCMVGYKLDHAHYHQGFMTEALSTLLPIVAKEYYLRRIEAMVMPTNLASIHLLENLGFLKEGYLHSFAQINGVWKDHLLYTYLPQI